MTKGVIIAINANLVTVRHDGPVGQNEICYITYKNIRIMAEVIRIKGSNAYAQVFESTRGLHAGLEVEFSGHMLEIELGPGILSRNYDGLQNDLEKLHGVFIQRGDRSDPLDAVTMYSFTPIAEVSETLQAGDWLGNVRENWIDHKIMVPFAFDDTWKLTYISPAGEYRIDDHIATVINSNGEEKKITMRQKWPIKKPIVSYKEKVRPWKLMETGIRSIDVLNPMVEGGSGFIPGPFGCGKTVLQHSLSKNAEADLIIITACGERANEVVEIFTEFPQLEDPRTGRKLMERTTIVCNTSNMPVAAREASIYTGMTIAEYYRAMGLRVLLLADSTSRWAQALREMSNRLEELPGPDAFPMDLSAVISTFYARAGFTWLHNGKSGSVTFIGTVSPAGGNLKEPVTESTKKASRCFYALSQKRADTKRYPAIDPLDSYSKYLEYPELRTYLEERMEPGWAQKVEKVRDILRRGLAAKDQISILGDDSVPMDYHDIFWKSELIDFVILQQDAFDKIDSNTPLDRQKFMLNLILQTSEAEFRYSHYEEVGIFFKQLINLFKQMNYSEFHSESFSNHQKEMEKLVTSRLIQNAEEGSVV